MAKDTDFNSGPAQAQISKPRPTLSREQIALFFTTALLFRKDGSGTGSGIVSQGFKYADAFLAHIETEK